MCSMLRTLVLRLNGLLDERWVQSALYFRRVCICNIFLFLPWANNFGMIFARFVGHGRWNIRVVYCVSGGARDDLQLASDCCVY